MKSFRKQKQPTQRLRQPTGRSGRSTAFSYHANRAEQDVNLGRLQPRNQDNRRREKLVRYWRQRIGALIATLAVLVCAGYIVQLSSQPKVIALASNTNATFLQPASVYQAAATKLLDSSMLNGNKLTVNTSKIEADLRAQYPELSEVSIVLPLLSHRPIIYVAANHPSLIVKSGQQEVLLGDDGKALLYADQIPNLNSLKLPVVTDSSNLKLSVNQTILPRSSVTFIRNIQSEFTQKNTTIESMTVSGNAYQLDVKPQGVGYYVKFNMHSDSALQQAGTYFAVKQRLATQNTTPANYIDVRLDGRAYYK